MARTEHPVSEDAEHLFDCSQCKKFLPRTLEFFPKDSWMRDGMSVRCRKCLSKNTMESRRRRRAKERGECA
jgi:hypothetical protein